MNLFPASGFLKLTKCLLSGVSKSGFQAVKQQQQVKCQVLVLGHESTDKGIVSHFGKIHFFTELEDHSHICAFSTELLGLARLKFNVIN